MAGEIEGDGQQEAGPPYSVKRWELIQRASRSWTGQLVDLTGRNNLLYYRDLKVGTLPLDRVPAAADRCCSRAGRVSASSSPTRTRWPTPASALARSTTRPDDLRGARHRHAVPRVRTGDVGQPEEPPTPPRRCCWCRAALPARGAAQQNFDLSVTGELEVNPTFLQRWRPSSTSSATRRSCCASGDGRRDRHPEELEIAFAWLAEKARRCPDSRSTERCVSATSPTRSCRWSATSRLGRGARRARSDRRARRRRRRPAGRPRPQGRRRSDAARPDAAGRRVPGPGRRLEPELRDQQGARRPGPGHQGPARNRQEPDDQQPHLRLVARGKTRAVRRREARRDRRRLASASNRSAWTTSSSTSTAAFSSKRQVAQSLARGAAHQRDDRPAGPRRTSIQRLEARRARAQRVEDGAARATASRGVCRSSPPRSGCSRSARRPRPRCAFAAPKLTRLTADGARARPRAASGVRRPRRPAAAASASPWAGLADHDPRGGRTCARSRRRRSPCARSSRCLTDSSRRARRSGMPAPDTRARVGDRLLLWERRASTLEHFDAELFDDDLEPLAERARAARRGRRGDGCPPPSATASTAPRTSARKALQRDGVKLRKAGLLDAHRRPPPSSSASGRPPAPTARRAAGGPRRPAGRRTPPLRGGPRELSRDLRRDRSVADGSRAAVVERLRRAARRRRDPRPAAGPAPPPSGARRRRADRARRRPAPLEPRRRGRRWTTLRVLPDGVDRRRTSPQRPPRRRRSTATSTRPPSEDFQHADRRHIATTAQRVRRLAAERAHRVGDGAARPGERWSSARRPRRRRTCRCARRFNTAPEVMTSIKPCWVMSPLVVSQVLPTDRPYFDVVIFDEASQVRPAEAIPAILRGRQLVVAGDEQQLPPTDFFSSRCQPRRRRARTIAEAAPTWSTRASSRSSTRSSSLVELADARVALPQPDERLIAFSNAHLYDRSR